MATAPGPTTTTTPYTDAAATSAPANYNSAAVDSTTADLVAQWIKANGLKADQANPQALHSITQMLHQHGIDAQVDYTDANGHTGGILVNGQPYQLIDGSNNWTALQPWEKGGGGSGGGGNQQQPFAYPSFDEKFSYPAFQAPTGVDEQNDPGFKARLEAGQQALERSAAARGTLLTGGTLKDEQQFAQDYASNEFGNVYNRAAQSYGTNYNAAANQYNTRLGAYQTNFGNALSSYGTNFGVDQALWGRAFNQNNQGFAQLYDLASLGLNAAGATNTAGQHYTDAAGNLITGAGNANAAGQVASGNAWNQAFGNIANYAQYASLYRNRPQGIPDAQMGSYT